MNNVRILSIDAWRDGDGWTWNQWFNVGEIDLDAVNIDNARQLLKYMRSEGYLKASSAGRAAIEDDGYNVVILDKNTREPIFAIEYGASQ